jgi:acyl-CoA synthetase (AMP-forming)/AMP-acid ligase II
VIIQQEKINKGLISGFMMSAENFPDRPALDVDDRVYTYKELAQESLKIAQAINNVSSDNPFVALLGYRSITAYAGILGILAARKGYVPFRIFQWSVF